MTSEVPICSQTFSLYSQCSQVVLPKKHLKVSEFCRSDVGYLWLFFKSARTYCTTLYLRWTRGPVHFFATSAVAELYICTCRSTGIRSWEEGSCSTKLRAHAAVPRVIRGLAPCHLLLSGFTGVRHSKWFSKYRNHEKTSQALSEFSIMRKDHKSAAILT